MIYALYNLTSHILQAITKNKIK